jgi:hypothetical protein
VIAEIRKCPIGFHSSGPGLSLVRRVAGGEKNSNAEMPVIAVIA